MVAETISSTYLWAGLDGARNLYKVYRATDERSTRWAMPARLNRTFFLKYPGIFTASITGVYSVFFRTFTNSQHSKLHVKKNLASGSGEQEVCSAVVHDNDGSGDSCSMYVELNVGDQLYVKGQGSETGTVFAPNDTRKFVSFLIHLLYSAKPLN